MVVGMIDISDKYESLRIAVAQSIISVDPQISDYIKDGSSPKGNIFEIAKAAATMAAKKTSDLIPYCHPIPIDDIKIEITIKENIITLNVRVKSIWKTGVEMEALTGASIGALTIYDMLKPLDKCLTIQSIKLLEKCGGRSNFHDTSNNKLKAAVIVISDSRNANSDKSGKLINNELKTLEFDVVEYKIIPDKLDIIQSELIYCCKDLNVDLVITTGGTGVGPRDVTPEATKKVIEKELDGVTEYLRNYGQSRTPLSMLSRGVSGICGKTVIINLPGSIIAVSQSLHALFPGILHIFKMIAGHGH